MGCGASNPEGATEGATGVPEGPSPPPRQAHARDAVVAAPAASAPSTLPSLPPAAPLKDGRGFILTLVQPHFRLTSSTFWATFLLGVSRFPSATPA